jgi:ribonuclease Z
VYGPTPTVEFCDKIIGAAGAFQPDWMSRCNWYASLDVYQARGGVLPRQAPNVCATNITPGWSHATAEWTVTAGYADHAQPYLECVGYRFDLRGGKSVVFSGDTGLCDEMVELARGADLFFCMSLGAIVNESTKFGQCAPGVADPGDAGLMAQRARVKTLVLVHQGPEQSLRENRSQSIDAVRAVFSGEIVFGEEITTIEL